MAEFLWRLDGWIIDRFQVTSDWVQDMFGFGLVDQIRVLWAVDVVAWLLMFERFSLVAILMAIGSATMAVGYGQQSHGDARNSERMNWKELRYRLVWLCFCPASITAMALNPGRFMVAVACGTTLRWAISNLQACDIKPPKPGKIREFFRNLGRVALPSTGA